MLDLDVDVEVDLDDVEGPKWVAGRLVESFKLTF